MKKRIMIVEDDEGIIDTLCLILEYAGYEVDVKRTSNEIENSSFEVPNLILLDLRLSGSEKSGAELCIFFKEHPNTCNIPVIIVSAERYIVEVAKDCRSDGYIKKPFDIDEMLDKIKSYLI